MTVSFIYRDHQHWKSVELLRSKNVMAVNGSVGYLMDNKIPLLVYVVCDGSFYGINKNLFHKYS